MQGTAVKSDPDDGSTEFDLVINDRPMVTVFPNQDETVTITVVSINHKSDTVERESVNIPNECVAEIAAALHRIASAL